METVFVARYRRRPMTPGEKSRKAATSFGFERRRTGATDSSTRSRAPRMPGVSSSSIDAPPRSA